MLTSLMRTVPGAPEPFAMKSPSMKTLRVPSIASATPVLFSMLAPRRSSCDLIPASRNLTAPRSPAPLIEVTCRNINTPVTLTPSIPIAGPLSFTMRAFAKSISAPTLEPGSRMVPREPCPKAEKPSLKKALPLTCNRSPDSAGPWESMITALCTISWAARRASIKRRVPYVLPPQSRA